MLKAGTILMTLPLGKIDDISLVGDEQTEKEIKDLLRQPVGADGSH